MGPTSANAGFFFYLDGDGVRIIFSSLLRAPVTSLPASRPPVGSSPVSGRGKRKGGREGEKREGKRKTRRADADVQEEKGEKGDAQAAAAAAGKHARWGRTRDGRRQGGKVGSSCTPQLPCTPQLGKPFPQLRNT